MCRSHRELDDHVSVEVVIIQHTKPLLLMLFTNEEFFSIVWGNVFIIN